MLSSYTPVATLSSKDLATARAFYEDALGLTAEREEASGTAVVYACGSGHLFVYESAYAGTNQATGVTIEVPIDRFDAEIEDLRAHGVELMTFDMEGIEWHDGVAVMGDARAAWFADPDGNILNVSAGGL